MSRTRLLRAAAVGSVATFLGLTGTASAAQPVFYGVAQIGAKVPNVRYSGTLGAAFLEGKTSKAKITCLGGTSSGEVTGTETIKHVLIIFTGCESAGLKCNSAGQAQGTIDTNELGGTLGNVTLTTPGIRLYKEGEAGKEPKSGALEEFECGGGIWREVVSGSIIGSLSGAQGKTVAEGKFASSTKLTFALNLPGKQHYETFLAGECGGAGECGPEQLTATINGGSELWAQSVIETLKTVPSAGKLGFTK